MEKLNSILSRLERFTRDHQKSAIVAAKLIFINGFVAYIVASALSAAMIPLLSDAALEAPRVRSLGESYVDQRKDVNYRSVRKSVLGRNLFNSDGELPDEEAPEQPKEEVSVFDADAPCQKATMAVDLIGTIYLGPKHPGSLATVRERGYNIADIYRVGDSIVGHEQAVVYAVQPKRLILNNSGKKECLELKESKSRAFTSESPSQEPSSVERVEDNQGEEGNRVVLDHEFVAEALGVGYAKILKQGRLVPHSEDNRIVGYKLIGVKGGSLYTKIGLKSGDVITNVNGISMAQVEQGFALYSALSEEKEIRIEFLQKGKNPKTITVEIR